MKCPQCGKEIAADSIFCEFCGKQVGQVQKPVNLLWMWITIIVVLVVAMSVMWNYQNGELIRARQDRNEIHQTLSDLRTAVPLVINDIQIANTDYDGNVETEAGGMIYSRRSMYLKPTIYYTGYGYSGNRTFNIRLYTPYGTLSSGSGSPKGYTYSDEEYIYEGENSTTLSGWGGKDKGHWAKGTYRIEVWYGEMCLKEKIFTIY